MLEAGLVGELIKHVKVIKSGELSRKITLKGVGANLQDHLDVCMSWECPQPIWSYSTHGRPVVCARSATEMVSGTRISRTIGSTFRRSFSPRAA